MQPDLQDRRTKQHFSGCLLGGAVGDALGAPVEFLSIDEIRDKYGPAGIADYDLAYGSRGAITDDTQMTLFTAEGVLRADVRWHRKGISHPASVIHHAYIRWLHTQGEQSRSQFSQEKMDGWLIGVKSLSARWNGYVRSSRHDTRAAIAVEVGGDRHADRLMRPSRYPVTAFAEGTAFAKNDNRSLLGSVNDVSFHTQFCLRTSDLETWQYCRESVEDGRQGGQEAPRRGQRREWPGWWPPKAQSLRITSEISGGRNRWNTSAQRAGSVTRGLLA